MSSTRLTNREVVSSTSTHLQTLNQMTSKGVIYVEEDTGRMVLGDGVRNYNDIPSNVLSADNATFLSHWRYDEPTRRLVSDKAIETTLNSLYLGEQHKMSSGSENIYFTNLTSDINFFPMWGGLKDQSITTNRDATGFIPPSGRVYTDMFSLPLGGAPNALTSVGYDGDNYFGINISGLGITTIAAETVGPEIRLEYRIVINGRQVYMQELPRAAARSSAGATIYPGDTIEWFFDHPVDVHAGTTLRASIFKVRNSDDADLGIFQVRQGDTVDPNTGLLRYQATVHNRLYEDKDLELISPYLKYKAMDFSVDSTGTSILLKDLTLAVGSQMLIPHNINTIQAIANGTEIKIMVKDGAKILIESLPVSAVSINGTLVNSVLANAVTELNNLFTNTLSFASQGNAVTNFVISGNDLTLTLSDATSFTVDITTLGVDTNNFVSSGVISGTDLVLTMSDASTVTIDVANMINGATMSAVNDQWYISYGANANQPVASDLIDGTLVGGTEVRLQGPYYFGQSLLRGSEFKFNMQTGNQLRLGIWDGAEVATSYTGSPSMAEANNWNTVFSFANGSGKFTSSTNTDVTTYHASGYTAVQGAPMSLRFGTDGHLTLVDVSGGTEVIVAKTTIALTVTSFNLQFGGFNNSVFPNGIIKDSGWSIVHDFDSSEAGIVNGIEDHTVLKSDISIAIGEKIMFMLDEVGQGDYFGTNYSAASTGVTTAEEQLDNEFKYETNEAISFEFGGTSDWNVNTNATYYFDNGAGVVGYRKGGASTIQGMFSLRFNNDGKLTVYSEDNNEKIATAKVDPAVGSSVHLYFGVKANRAYYSIPVISKQSITGGSQPNLTFAPDVSDQSFTIEENTAFNFQIALDANSDIVNMYGESDAPSWAVLNQVTGQIIGTSAAFGGSNAYVINCKAANAIGGITNFTVTINVTEAAYTNSKSLTFDGTTEWLQGNPINMTALERATNGDGNGWTISMWVKPDTTNTGNQTLLVYGAGDDYNGGAITLKQSGGTTLVLNYGTVYDNIILVAANSFVNNTWQHVMITFDGGTTGVDVNQSGAYYGRFNIYVDGVAKFKIGVATNGGYDGSISGAVVSDNIYRIGRANNIHNNYYDGIINQVGIWDTDQSANVATIYNSGATQNLSDLTVAPAHYYEIETSVTTVADIEGSAPLTGYNFVTGDLVTDAP